jgi:hypothetical protein
MGTWATGAVVASLAGAWSALLGWLGSGRTESSERRPHRIAA